MTLINNSLLLRVALVALFMGALSYAAGQDAPAPARNFEQVEISPNAARIAWVQDSLNDAGEMAGTEVYVQELKSLNARPRRITAGSGMNASEDSIAWSPDSQRVVFLSDAAGDGRSQLYIADAAGGSVRKLTSLNGPLASPAWSPDGTSIAVLFTENAPNAANPLNAMLPETGVIESKVYEQRLAVVDVVSGKARQLSPADMYVYEYDWSPDGKSFAVIAAHGAGDANWYVAQLYTLSRDGGELKPIHKPKLQIATPRWSPDGAAIAFIEGLMSDQGFVGGDIFVVAANGGEAQDATPGIAASPAGLYWQTPQKIFFTENIDGQAGASVLDLSTRKITALWTAAATITEGFWGGTSLSMAADHQTTAAIRSSFTGPPEIWAGPVGDWKQVTHVNQAVHPDWGELKSLHWTNRGFNVQGWLLYPKNFDARRHYPMVVDVHGGPAGVAHVGWPGGFYETIDLSPRGYFVFLPNPRGSFGEGEKFTEANVKDFGYGDLQDILAGVDEVIKTAPVDNDRIGLTGWSYGGFMTMWAVTQTHRFRAAVAGAGIANWESYYGENDIDEWMIPYFGATVYDDPAVYAKSSPIDFIKNVSTPTLVLVGERDGECPAPQSREFWHALKTEGVETQLVIYPGEGHVFNQPEHQRDAMQRLDTWFDHYLKP
jgi:dipeptidyl aminopeptidase/acylaminoacyl peptidase